MPKKFKKRKTNRPKRANTLQYADKSLEQKYGRVVKELGCRNFSIELLDGQERMASLTKGVARRAPKRLKIGDLVLIHPMSDDVYGMQEIVTIYGDRFEKQLRDEGKLAIVKEKEVKKEEAFVIDDGQDKEAEIVFNENDLDIDDL